MLVGPVRVGVTMHLTWLAEAHIRAGSIDEAGVAAEDALRVNPQELFMRPESLRIRGEIRVRVGRLAEAEHDFVSAIELANRMGARRFAQRATTGLQDLLRAGARRRAPSLASAVAQALAHRGAVPRIAQLRAHDERARDAAALRP